MNATQIKHNIKVAKERSARLDALAERTADAYSFDRYGARVWRLCVRMLDQRGYNEREIEAILRSKWTRWAADTAGQYRSTSIYLSRFIDTIPEPERSRQVAQLVEETFGGDR